MNPTEALTRGFKECEKNFLQLVEMAHSRA
jgi:hypothetical protein